MESINQIIANMTELTADEVEHVTGAAPITCTITTTRCDRDGCITVTQTNVVDGATL